MMELVTPHLKSVLKNYQHSATKSLQGPGLSLIQPKRELNSPEIKEECISVVTTTSNTTNSDYTSNSLRFPVLAAADTGRSERTETILEGESISCFVVGGEKRLCLPQVLNSVLRDFSLFQINQECDRLQIFCSRCTPDQLAELKNTAILPGSAHSCGLITKTDAERLCSALLHSAGVVVQPTLPPPKPPPCSTLTTATTNGDSKDSPTSIVSSTSNPSSTSPSSTTTPGGKVCTTTTTPPTTTTTPKPPPTTTTSPVGAVTAVDSATSGVSFRVYHECFGRCSGTCTPSLFTHRDARCVVCTECRGAYSPQHFVCHAHRDRETRTCHWGFESANWRAYVRVQRDHQDRQLCERLLDEMRDMYEGRVPFPQGVVGGDSKDAKDRTSSRASPAQIKRKQMFPDMDHLKPSPAELLEHMKGDRFNLPVKKLKLNEYAAYLYASAAALDPLYIHAAMYDQWSAARPLSAFRPLHNGYQHLAKDLESTTTTAVNSLPLQHHQIKQESNPHHIPKIYEHKNTKPVSPLGEPPRLQNPERVVPHSESEKYENSYQPNVALATSGHKKYRHKHINNSVVADTKKEDSGSISSTSISSAEVSVIAKENTTRTTQEPIEQQPTVITTRSITQQQTKAVYNSEIELSTDTDDSFSDVASEAPKVVATITTTPQKRISSPQENITISYVKQVEELLRDCDKNVRSRVVSLVQVLANDCNNLEIVCREKDEVIQALKARCVELENTTTTTSGVVVVNETTTANTSAIIIKTEPE